MADDPIWADQEIDERRNTLPPAVQAVAGVDPDVSQDPDLHFGMPMLYRIQIGPRRGDR